jgi:hypothetical protein
MQTKEFIKKHKTAIIIGVVIVVAVIVVTIAVVASSSNEEIDTNEESVLITAAIGTGGGTLYKNSTVKTLLDDSYLKEEISDQIKAEIVDHELFSSLEEKGRECGSQIAHENFEYLIEMLPLKKDLPEKHVASFLFSERAREFGSHLTHEALYVVSELASVLPQLQEELVNLSERFLPEGLVPEESKYAKENFDIWIAQGHEKIDRTFSSNHADYYTTSARSEENQNIIKGEIPLPSNLTSAFRMANSGGKHALFLKNSLNYTRKQLQKGILSFDKQISLHQNKIANPNKYIEGWDQLDPRQQIALINKKWPSDIERLTEQRDILHDVLQAKLSR